MTREEAINILKSLKIYYNDKNEDSYVEFDTEDNKALDMAIESLEQQPCEDCISRTELLSRIDAERKHLLDLKMDGAEHIVVHHARRIIEDMPSVTPQPKIGRWEWVQYDSNPNIGNWHCSECRTIIPHMPENANNTPIYKWCPNCGAKMEAQE